MTSFEKAMKSFVGLEGFAGVAKSIGMKARDESEGLVRSVTGGGSSAELAFFFLSDTLIEGFIV